MTPVDRRLRGIGDRFVGPGQPVYVVGEIGINHNGDLANALALIDAARSAGMDAAVATGAVLVERYITLDRAMWASEQVA